MPKVYFDNAATTQIRDEVIDAMTKVLKHHYGNASSQHSFGRTSKAWIEKARKTIAAYLNVQAGEIVFTSGGTEANNLILNSAVKDLGVKHIITSKIEHHAVLNVIHRLVKDYDVKVSYVALNSLGDVDFNDLEALLQDNRKTLVSLMHINNEIGNILDIKRVSELCKTNNALFHSDAVQSVGHYPIDLQEIKLDFLTASAHKFHGPKGVGFLFVRKNSGIKPQILGGEQERGLRAGTESTHNIVGLEHAFKLAHDNFHSEQNYIKSLKQYFIESVKSRIPNVLFNGQSGNVISSSYAIVNICFPIPKEKANILLFQLDLKGIACSRGSACQSGSVKSSHVLAEILDQDTLNKTSIRFSFSVYNTKEDVNFVIDILINLLNS